MKRRHLVSFFLLIFLLSILTLSVSGQDAAFTVHMRRNFGYGAGANVRGTFTISLVGDESKVDSVDFLIDGEVMASVAVTPFSFQFHTDDFGFGMHQLSARVMLQDGSLEITPAVGYNFLSPMQERESMVILLLGIGGAIIGALAIFGVIQAVMIKGKPRTSTQTVGPRQYGLLGGTICPKCGRAFPRHIWGLKLIVGRLDRCEHCGKWVMTVRATPDQLNAAEEAEIEALPADTAKATFQHAVKDTLEDTKYVDEI